MPESTAPFLTSLVELLRHDRILGRSSDRVDVRRNYARNGNRAPTKSPRRNSNLQHADRDALLRRIHRFCHSECAVAVVDSASRGDRRLSVFTVWCTLRT